jgi:hypothetical protein
VDFGSLDAVTTRARTTTRFEHAVAFNDTDRGRDLTWCAFGEATLTVAPEPAATATIGARRKHRIRRKDTFSSSSQTACMISECEDSMNRMLPAPRALAGYETTGLALVPILELATSS